MTDVDTEVAKMLGYSSARPKFTTDIRAAETLSTWLLDRGIRVETLVLGMTRDGIEIGATLRLTGARAPKAVYGTVSSGSGPTGGAALCDALLALREAVGPDVFRQIQQTLALR